MDKCLETRKYLLDWGAIESLAPMIYCGSDGYPNDGTEEGKAIVKHLQSCTKCKFWLHDYTTSDQVQRMERLSQYCCPQMFVAVEEPQENHIKLKLMRFRDEFLWAIDQPEREFGFEFFGFCPWCGNKLPDQPFINDDLGRG